MPQRCPTHALSSMAHDVGARGDPEGAPRSVFAECHDRRDVALSLQKLGTRAVVAEALASEAENVERAVRLLCRSAGGGDLQAARALIPWLNQGLGMPTERVEHRSPSTLAEVQELSSDE